MSPRQQQVAEALARAMEVKDLRSKLKRDLKVRDADALDLLLRPPGWLEKMVIIDFVMALPRVGRYRAIKFIEQVGAGEQREIGRLTLRQRNALHKKLIKL